jgi:hypothetical protein
VADRPLGLRDVVVTAGTCVVAVALAAGVTWLLPADLRGIVFRSPLIIVVLIVGTTVALWRIARPGGAASTPPTASPGPSPSSTAPNPPQPPGE